MRKQKRVALFEFPVFPRGFPLVSGYLEAFAKTNAVIDGTFEFLKHSFPLKSAQIVEAIDEVDADVYAFSCYVWNMGLVRRLLPRLIERRPDALIVLGGPQVMFSADRYLNADHENLVLCNGEGERTFADLLSQVAAQCRDFSSVRGLSFYRNRELTVTDNHNRIQNLNEIPSPYLEGCFNPSDYVWAAVETNRGCPFKCTYCYWGAATNSPVHTYEEDRIFAELEWLSSNGVMYIVFIDANFGILERDIRIAQHLAKCKRRYGAPLTVAFSSSKNTPERVSQITRIFEEARLIATQPISLQTTSSSALSAVKRSNIKTSSYTQLQQVLNENNASSFIELIWPLPGETLRTYQEGVSQLCSQGADSFSVYPLLLINNVQLQEQRREHSLVTIADPDPDSEAEIVVSTRDVSYPDFLDGLRFACHLTSLYSLRGLRFVASYLDETGVIPYEGLFSAFSASCAKLRNHPYTDFIQKTIDELDRDPSGLLLNSEGAVVHLTLHSAREEFEELLARFVVDQGWLADPNIRFRLELDLLNHPHAYRNTPIVERRMRFELIRLVSVTSGGYIVEIPAEYRQTAGRLLHNESLFGAPYASVNYRTTQLPYMPGKPLKDNYSYCQDRLRRARSLLPQWKVVPA